jgi:hypothetical protein
MSNKPLVKVNAAAATDVCARFDLKNEARALLREGMGSREFLEALLDNKQYLAGIDFIAHALSAREAVWWGCLSLQHVCGNNLSVVDKQACKAAVQWVLEPTDENRAAAKAPAEVAGPGSSAGALAEAANKSRENHARSKTSPSSLESFALAKAVIGAVKIALSKVDPLKIPETQRLLAELGIGVAEGRFVPPEVRNRVVGRLAQAPGHRAST